MPGGAVFRLVFFLQFGGDPVLIRVVFRFRVRLGKLIVRGAALLRGCRARTRGQYRTERHVRRGLNERTGFGANSAWNGNHHVIARTEGGGNLRLGNARAINALTDNFNCLVQLLLADRFIL